MKKVIFDIDGTLADCSRRVHHLMKKPKDWDAFFAEMESDPPNLPVVELCRAMHQRGHRIVLCTGRYEKHRLVTNQWLERNGVPYHEIRMRRNDDKRSDVEVKKEMVGPAEVQDILFVVEDRSRNVEMWRAQGLVCLQCDAGEF
jgi:phosphoglycolate phosphatase-like HAD superfamily hydrolase